MSELNNEQKLAVGHIDGPCMVIAGPGSGKTRVIAHRIINMVKNHSIPPTRILAISFTKASSLEMKSRTLDMGQDDRLKKVNFATFHSAFFRILRRYDGVSLEDLLSEVDRFKLAKSILKFLKVKDFSDDDVLDVLGEISYVKNDLIDYRDYESSTFESEVFQKIFELYEREKKKYNKIDFDDMLIKAFDLLKENAQVLSIVRQVFRYILIDEFQDINKVQFEVIRLIASPQNNIFVVGDEDQSIYGFRGARPDFMLDFDRYFEGAKKLVLKNNYRSKRTIVDMSSKLIKNNKNRYEKEIVASRNEEVKLRFIEPKDSDDEAIQIANQIKSMVEKKSSDYQYEDFSVIYRTNRQARPFVDAFMDQRIPFVLKDSAKTIYEHWVSLDILAYLRIAMNIGTNDDWVRIINKPFRYISKASVSRASKSDDFFDSLLKDDDLKSFQKRDLEDLFEDLNYVRGLRPEYAISYIRSTLDYDRYVLEYCHERRVKSKAIVEILDELETSSKAFKTSFDFFKHIDEVKEEVRKRTNKSKNPASLSDFETKGVVLTTMHSSKGLEFPNVYIAGLNEGLVPYVRSSDEDIDEDHLEEERRLLYVAITRAKDSLVISSPAKRFGKRIGKSLFMDEIM
ncbi:ATP-dependent helicase [Peptostreptococcus anaerobius]|uniref:ATP-dependent helicase n=1 Tax=Peptostreptococcus anaerobius TaxID=1261 RepID=UPI003D6DC511